jgi:hypothetical protein
LRKLYFDAKIIGGERYKRQQKIRVIFKTRLRIRRCDVCISKTFFLITLLVTKEKFVPLHRPKDSGGLGIAI